MLSVTQDSELNMQSKQSSVAEGRGASSRAPVCCVPSAEQRVHLQSILIPPNNKVINRAVKYLLFHLCLIRAYSASTLEWQQSFSIKQSKLLLNLWVN